MSAPGPSRGRSSAGGVSWAVSIGLLAYALGAAATGVLTTVVIAGLVVVVAGALVRARVRRRRRSAVSG